MDMSLAKKILTWERRRKLKRWLARSRLIVLNQNDPARRRVFDLIRQVDGETQLGIDYIEACQLHMAVTQTGKVPGDVAEVGVYRGGSARIICEAKGRRELHLFDTFAGLPQVDSIDASHFSPGDWAGSLDAVRRYLAPYEGVHFHPGFFPETAGPVAEKKFSFVNLDVDTYQSTRDCIEFFYPRMSPGGVIVSHDYQWAEGVRKAVDEFFADKPEPVLTLAGSQCLVVKLG